MPACLFLSYHPVISLGANETMNFELSVALIWLVVFDAVSLIMMVRRRLVREVWRAGGRRKWLWPMFPLWLTVTAVASLNVTRGVLTVGILWLVYFAVLAMVTVGPAVIPDFSEFRKTWLKWFLGAALVACGWCFLQCILDLAGMEQGATLLCDGCVSEMFGFPHPNGWAIEPQFMGNLLLAPAIISVWLALNERHQKDTPQTRSRRRLSSQGRRSCSLVVTPRASSECLFWCLFCIFDITIFLTFSRGAIYALVVAMVFFTMMEVVRRKGSGRWRVLWVWAVLMGAFMFTLNVQGVMAAVGPTNDTYATGVAKVVNHLSLGVIDWRGDNGDFAEENVVQEVAPGEQRGVIEGAVVADGPMTEMAHGLTTEMMSKETAATERQEAVFGGYVAESTDTRLRLTGAAIEVWRSSAETVLFGVGLGGAGRALYEHGLSPAPKEIVQNEYASLLLETGLVGVALFCVTVGLVIYFAVKHPAREALLTLLVAYGVTLCFFSGLPNALQIYLMPGVVWLVFKKNEAAGRG